MDGPVTVADRTEGRSRCPFVGARPFEGADRVFFFGRDREAHNLANMVAACTLTVVYGPSGAGKSSLLNTLLSDELALIEPDWICISFSSWQAGFEGPLLRAVTAGIELALATDKAIPAPPDTGQPSLRIQDLPQKLLGTARDTGRPIVLVLDQFEEYFLYHGAGAAAFEASLARLANRRNSPVRVVLSLRSDRLFLLDRLRGGIPEILQNLFLVDPLDESGARDAVLEPVAAYNRQTGATIDVPPEVVDAIVKGADEREIFQRLPFRGRGVARSASADAAQASPRRLRIVAPFLQLALESLWNRDIVETPGGTGLTLLGLRALASATDDAAAVTLVGQLAQRHLDTILSQRSEAEQAVCAKLFERMVTYAGGKVAIALPDDFVAVLDARQLTLAAELLESLAVPGSSRLVRRVATDDLVTGDHGASARVRYEIVHDALAVPILDWVARWRQRRAQIEAAEQEQAAAAEALKEAERREALERAQREAERARHDAAEASERRRVRFLQWGSAGFLAVLTLAVLTGWGVMDYRARRDAIQRYNVFAEKDSSPEFRLRLLLAMSSLSQASGPWSYVLDSKNAEMLLRDTLLRSPCYDQTALAAGFDSDGSRLAVLTTSGELSVVSLRDGVSHIVATASQLHMPSWQSSSSEKLRQLPVVATGFVQGLATPVIVRWGVLHYQPNPDTSQWQSIDLADLVPDGFDTLPGVIRPEITAGAVQLTAQNFSSDVRVVRLRPVPGDQEPNFDKLTTTPPAIRWRGQRFASALSPWLESAPHDRFASLDLAPNNPSQGQYTAPELTAGDLSTGSASLLWRGESRLPEERVQEGIDTGGATIQPSAAFSDNREAIVIRIGPHVQIIDLATDGKARASAAPLVSFQAPKDVGDMVVPGLWGGRPLIAAAAAAGANESRWRVAWFTSDGLEIEQARAGSDQALSRLTLLTGQDNAMRLNFSSDGRFAMIWLLDPERRMSGTEERMQQVRVWDLSEDWHNSIAGAKRAQLIALACQTAAREPGGKNFTPDETITWIGTGATQPCSQ